MLKKLSFKFNVYIVLIVTLLSAVFVPIYMYSQKESYIFSELNTMQKFYDGFKKIDFTSEKYVIDTYVNDHDTRNYTIVISDDMFNRVYVTSSAQSDSDIHFEKIAKHIKKYSENAVPEYYDRPKKRTEEILLRKIQEQNGEIFYVYIYENVKSVNSVLSYTNKNIIVILIGYTLVCVFILSLLFNSLANRIKKLSAVTEKISKKDYSVRYDGKIKSDELGALSKNINEMADTIQENINSLKNYNFLLKEDLNYMAEYDKIRQNVVSNLTHELKTPLAIISSQVEMMNCMTDEKKREKYYVSAISEIDKMSHLISKFLNYSVMEHNIFTEEAKIIDLSKMVSSLCEDSKDYVISNNIEFQTDIEKNCVLNIEENHIEHVFNNYLSNAIHHADEAGMIEVKLKKHNEKIRLSVYNKGEGIDEKYKDKIWSNFFTADKNYDDSDAHSGLGLFIVKEISIIEHTDCGFINRDNGVEFWFDFVDKLV